MDRLVIIPSVPQTEWVQDVLPGTSPAELPVAGRYAIDYALERVHAYGGLLTEVLDFHASSRLANLFRELTGHASVTFYQPGEGPLPQGLNDLASIPGPLTQSISDGLTVCWGICLPTLRTEDVRLEPVSPEDCARTPLGLYRHAAGIWQRVCPDARLNIIQDIRSWHEANFTVLHNPDVFTLPGYSSEKGVHLGRNVVIEIGADIKGPVLLDNRSWLARNVQLQGDVIVGKGAYVGESSRLVRSVVGNETYIGVGVELVDKIAIRNRVIDAVTGVWVDLDEQGLISPIGTRGIRWLRTLVNILYGRSGGGQT